MEQWKQRIKKAANVKNFEDEVLGTDTAYVGNHISRLYILLSTARHCDLDSTTYHAATHDPLWHQLLMFYLSIFQFYDVVWVRVFPLSLNLTHSPQGRDGINSVFIYQSESFKLTLKTGPHINLNPNHYYWDIICVVLKQPMY